MGRPLGSPNKDKPWAEALRRVVFQDDASGRRRLVAIAEKCALAAEDGDLAAIREIGDRLDGKAAQSMDMTVRTIAARDLGDDELADIATGSGEGADPAPIDPSQLN